MLPVLDCVRQTIIQARWSDIVADDKKETERTVGYDSLSLKP